MAIFGIAGHVVAVHDVRAVAKIELVIVQLVDGLDVVAADVIARHQVVDQVCVESVDGLLLGKADLHAGGKYSRPEFVCGKGAAVEPGLLDCCN